MKELQQVMNHLQLGTILHAPERVYGGLLHRMYKVETDLGIYAVKELNPTIMKRPRVKEKLEMSEFVSRRALKEGIPAVCALGVEERVHCVIGRHFMVFPWIAAEQKAGELATEEECRKIGRILALIHNQSFPEAEALYQCAEKLEPIDWSFPQMIGGECKGSLQEQRDQLEEWDRRAVAASASLLKHQQISHRDLDCKNVLWDEQGNPYVIDWEATGWVNPAAELLETACAWSGAETDTFDPEKFDAVITSYSKTGGSLTADWEAVMDFGFRNKLEWLFYNYKRCFGMEASDAEECALAEREVDETFGALQAYEALRPIIEARLKRTTFISQKEKMKQGGCDGV